MTYTLPVSANYVDEVTPLFGPLNIYDVTINGAKMSIDVINAVTDIVVDSTLTGASTITITVSDPKRVILRSEIIAIGDTITLYGLNYTIVEVTKTADTIQFIAEATTINQLRQQKGATASSMTTDITSFAKSLVLAIPGLSFVGDPMPAIFPVAIGRGSAGDPTEDSWTCLTRIAGTAGWRCFEYNNTVYFGSDQFFMNSPVSATFQEFTNSILNMDFVTDYGQPFGNLTATATIGLITFAPANVVNVVNMGIANGLWLVSDMQRDAYNPEAQITLQTPLTPAQVLTNIANPALAYIQAIASNAASTATSSSGSTSSATGIPSPSVGDPANGVPNMTVDVSPNPTTRNTSFTVTCSVSGGGLGVTPTGTVQFVRNGAPMAGNRNNNGGVPLVNGIAFLTESSGLKNAGPNQIVCTYFPDQASKWQQADTSQNPKAFIVGT